MRPPIIAFFFLSLLLNSTFAVAIPAGGFSSPDSAPSQTFIPSETIPAAPSGISNSPSLLSTEYTVISFQASGNSLNGGNGSACRISELSASEVQRLKDAVLVPGLVGNEISAGTPPDASRDKVTDNNKLLIPNPSDSETAFQRGIPTEILHPSELSPLQNQNIRGPFAFGVSIDDTLRAARCVDDASCAVLGEKLALRNSGEGISGNVKDIYQSVVGDLDKPDSKFKPEEADYLRAQIQGEQDLETPDANHVYVQGVSRTPTVDLMNHIRADNTFSGGMLTNCDNGMCVMTLYSMFDKYFNSWFSGEMVVSTFGPTLWGQFRKMLVKGKRFNILPAKIADYNPLKVLRDKKVSLFGAKGEPIAPTSFFTKYGGGSTGIDGVDVYRNYKRIFQRDADMGKVYDDVFIQRNVLSSGRYPPLEDQLFSPEGLLGKITDIDKRRKIFTYTGKLKEYSNVVKKMKVDLDKLVSEEISKGVKKPATQIAEDRLKAAQSYSRIFVDMDDAFNLDMRDTFKKLKEADFDLLFVKDKSTGKIVNLTSADAKYFEKGVYEPFMKKGNFSDAEYVLKTNSGNVQLYRIEPDHPLGIFDVLKAERGEYPPDAVARLYGGGILPVTKENIPEIIQNAKIAGREPQPVFSGIFKESEELTPEMFAEKILAADIMPGNVGKFSRHMDSLYETMVARDYGKGKYTNVLSRALQSQDDLVKNYFNVLNPNVVQSGWGWTAKMYGYWWITRGLGSDTFSIYQLPKEWTEVRFVPGESEFYNDAYMDFFANEGSDTGDMFQRVISNLPVPWILDQFASNYPTLKHGWDVINGSIVRTKPDNLAVYMFGSESCPQCTATIRSPTQDRFDIQYVSPESVNGFFLEHQKTADAKKEGQLLITFAHRTDIKGQVKGEALDEINLVQARLDGTTCDQVSQELFLYGPLIGLVGAEKAGAVLGVTESISYLSFGMGGALVTLANQLAIAPKMQDCVDDKEGYFASLFVPKESEKPADKANSDNLQKSVSQNALDGIREFANRIDQNHTDPSLTDKALHEATSKVKELVDEAQKNNVAEAELRVSGGSSGYLKSSEVMYFWVAGGGFIQPAEYLTEGRTLVTTEDGHTIALDNAKGSVTVDGQIVIDESSADHTRLAVKNLAIPAIEIPQRLNGYQLSDTNQWLLSVNVRGETIVQDPALLDCIQEAVLHQSGVPLNSNNMSEAFGKAQSVSTDAYPNISIDPIKNRILLGGQAPQTANGAGASINVFGDRTVIVTGAPNPNAGKFQSIQLETGSVLYKPQTNELIIWLRHHTAAVVKDTDVKSFAGTLTNTKNENTQCDEPAIDLRVETDPATPGTKLKGDNLTAGLLKNGPFQVFETDSKRFILYSKLVDGECVPYFKVINKATGQVYDQPISDIFQSEDGKITIRTADGQTHSLQFSDQNGKPVLTYDGNSELLRSAIGKGGSFYYDPTTGQYFAENAQLIPLNDNFRNQGVSFQANPDGTVSGKPGDNVFVINPAQGGQGLFNIPSIPQDLTGAALMLLLLTIVCAGIYLDSRKRKITL